MKFLFSNTKTVLLNFKCWSFLLMRFVFIKDAQVIMDRRKVTVYNVWTRSRL